MVTRGIKQCVDQFVNDMSAQYFPFSFQGKPGWVQLAMRPIQFWEVVFPKESLQTVMRTIWEKQESMQERPEMKWPFKAIRRALHLKKIPEIDPNIPKRIVYNQNIGFYGIGIKEDNYQDDGTTEDL